MMSLEFPASARDEPKLRPGLSEHQVLPDQGGLNTPSSVMELPETDGCGFCV